MGKGFARLGIADYWTFLKEFVYNIVTFQNGIVSTLLSLMWFMFVFRYVKHFFLYLWRQGLIRGVLAIVTTVIIGPIPTIVRFICLPALRLFCFIQSLLVDTGAKADNQNDKSDDPPVAASEAAGAGASDGATENKENVAEPDADEKTNS